MIAFIKSSKQSIAPTAIFSSPYYWTGELGGELISDLIGSDPLTIETTSYSREATLAI